jgi:serine/threonine-protein kinase
VSADLHSIQEALGSRYLVARQLGRGGMATVYLAEDLERRERVAVKVLRPELTVILGSTRFRQEIEILGRLQHPNIVPLLDWSATGPPLYYTMPFVAADSLRARLRQGQLPMDEALSIARDMAAAIDHAHAEGVLHRDIKPANVLLDVGRALICDFGIARAIERAGGESFSSSGLVIGTPTYMSPEQAAGAPVDRRSDIYSLGGVLYEMLAGEPPFSGASAQAVMARQVAEPPRSLRVVRPDVPEAVEAAVLAALDKHPAARPSSAQELVGRFF